MAEAKKNYANIENIDALLGGEGVGSLMKNVQITEKKVGDILRRLSSLEAEAARREPGAVCPRRKALPLPRRRKSPARKKRSKPALKTKSKIRFPKKRSRRKPK